MKKLIIVGMFSLALSQVQAQNEPKEIDIQLDKKTDVQHKPDFPGGMQMFYKYFATNFNYPDDSKFKGGRTLVEFIVEVDGSLTDIKVVVPLGFGIDEQLIKIFKASPLWIPATNNGEKIKCSYMMPINLSMAN